MKYNNLDWVKQEIQIQIFFLLLSLIRLFQTDPCRCNDLCFSYLAEFYHGSKKEVETTHDSDQDLLCSVDIMLSAFA